MSEMKPVKPRGRITAWILANEKLSTRLLLAGVTMIIACLGVLALPVGPTTTSTGRIVGTLPLHGKGGNGPLGFVEMANGRVYSLKLKLGYSCKIGDIVIVSETPRVWGLSHAIEPFGCNA